jgi:putative ABC transport system ATP-binding protein
MTEFSPIVRLEQVVLALTSAAGPVPILKGVDLELGAGEAAGLVGPSGSGKSTLMMAIAGLERANAGRVIVAGTDLGPLGEDALTAFRRAHVGIVFQSFHLIPTMTALENVAVPLELAGRADAVSESRRMLDAVGLGTRVAHYPGQLSGGEQQRVALARAFVARPPLLLADEPTGNLDRATGNAVIELLFALNAEVGTTMLLITHDSAIAERCDRVLRMEDGRVVPNGTGA